LQNFFNAPRT